MESPDEDTARSSPSADELVAERARVALVDRLAAQGAIHSPAVWQAMARVPRHHFLPGEPVAQAYADIAIPTHWEDHVAVSSASQPTMVAIMLEQLDLQPGMRVLEIGAGTGYNAALLADLVGPTGAVTTVEIDALIAEEARAHLWAAGEPRVRVVVGDGAEGYAEAAPYDRIVLTAGTADLSPDWVAQLVLGGRLVAPLRLGGVEASVALRKEEGALRSVSLTPCGFMRLRGAESAPEHTATLADGWRLAGERAVELREPIARLLATRPRRRLWARPSPLFPLYVGLDDPDFVYLWRESERRRRVAARPRGRFGVYAEGPDGPSLALVAPTLPVLLTFGGSAAERMLDDEVAHWRRVQYAPLESWRVTAYARGAEPPVEPSPYLVRLARRHFIFDVETAAQGA